MKLSDRLQLIADEIHCGETMADIGTDHGFLPLYLLEVKKCPKVIMADISRGSLAKAEENCKLAKAKGDYEFRLGNGIDVLEDGEVDVVVIAGMGGNLIADILEWNLKKSRSIKRYILQPRRHVGKLRHWLYCNGFQIVKESLVEEGKCIIMVTSDMEELLGMSDRIVVFGEKCMAGTLEKHEFSQERILDMASTGANH